MRAYEEIAADATEGRAFSNSTQYEIWADRWCYRCVHDDDETEKWCPILSVSLLGVKPKEWTTLDHVYADYQCTEFEERRDYDGDDPEPEPEPPPVIDGQIDIFEVFVDQVEQELARPVGVSA